MTHSERSTGFLGTSFGPRSSRPISRPI